MLEVIKLTPANKGSCELKKMYQWLRRNWDRTTLNCKPLLSTVLSPVIKWSEDSSYRKSPRVRSTFFEFWLFLWMDDILLPYVENRLRYLCYHRVMHNKMVCKRCGRPCHCIFLVLLDKICSFANIHSCYIKFDEFWLGCIFSSSEYEFVPIVCYILQKKKFTAGGYWSEVLWLHCF